MVVFVNLGYIDAIEFYTYGEIWDGTVSAYSIYSVETDGELTLLKHCDVEE